MKSMDAIEKLFSKRLSWLKALLRADALWRGWYRVAENICPTTCPNCNVKAVGSDCIKCKRRNK